MATVVSLFTAKVQIIFGFLMNEKYWRYDQSNYILLIYLLWQFLSYICFIFTHFSPSTSFVIFNQATQMVPLILSVALFVRIQRDKYIFKRRHLTNAISGFPNNLLINFFVRSIEKFLFIFSDGEEIQQPVHTLSKSINVKCLLIITLIINAVPFVLMSSSSESLNTQHIFYIYFVVAHVFAYILPILLCTNIGSYYVIECHISLP